MVRGAGFVKAEHTLSITGLTPLAAMAPHSISNICVEPTEMPCTLERVFVRSALPKANMLLLRKYPMIRGSEIL